MNRDRRTNQVRHDGRPPPAGTADRRVANGASHARPPAECRHPRYADRLRGETEEVGLTLVPPSRYRSVLVPLDGGPFGEHALPVALGIARRAGAEVRVVHVHCPLRSAYRPETLHYDGDLDAWLRRRRQAYLDDLLRRLAKVTSLPVTPVLMQGEEVASSLCEAARVGTDLVVLATHGRGPLGRLWHGNVAAALVRRLPVPLLLVRGHDAPADLTGDPVVRHVLVPLDGSGPSEQALEPALALGSLTGADHTLLRVLPPETGSSAGHGAVVQRPVGEGGQAEAWRYLRGVAGRLGGRTLLVHPQVVHDERPAASLNFHGTRTTHHFLPVLASFSPRQCGRLMGGL